ncbi:hypothetical protein [Burkholderia ubonensis]|uniref:hypothetical protein n=1 Tax=Burkholderia ubonensis TaxID=101571 RepID=UPI00075D2A50|nr:hypothetical protein [Burkholderia ubonensis]KVZ89449.1 hypothetical protein WL22_26475 [Burkholderia ubonensis]KWE32666.1 hypothetical protein WL75_31405 [Burkholderia ubonensis]
MSDTPRPPAFEVHHDLKSAPDVDAHHLARVSISGAEEALAKITAMLKRCDGEPDVNALQWHLRSFFWELCGAWDLFQQWVNTAFRLGYAEDKVAMTVIRQAKSNVTGWDEVKAILVAAFDSEWHFEVRAYRNSAHRSYFRMMEIHLQEKGVRWINLPAARHGQSNHFEGMVPQLTEYVRQTLAVGQQIADLKARMRT